MADTAALLRRLALLETNLLAEGARADAERARADEERALKNAERARADEERALKNAERARADHASARADEERALKNAERARADAAEKAAFLVRLASISAGGSNSPPSADYVRRGGPKDEVVGVDAILAGVPPLEDADVRAAWELFVAALASGGRAAAPTVAAGASVEIRVIQPVVAAVAQHAAGAESK